MAKQTRRGTPHSKPPLKRSKRKAPKGVIHIQLTINNTIATLTSLKGDVLCWCSAGTCGFKGARKGTPFAAQTVAETAARQSMGRGVMVTNVVVTGSTSGRKKALFGLAKTGIGISAIRDVTPLPHNGCRPPKKRRL